MTLSRKAILRRIAASLYLQNIRIVNGLQTNAGFYDDPRRVVKVALRLFGLIAQSGRLSVDGVL